ncbi:unnamed protein product [Amoebophrya sp. A120]|nr:unnamed protein product [Amoebophrya sp. A120]|eukprot:GSA120T00024176001.1
MDGRKKKAGRSRRHPILPRGRKQMVRRAFCLRRDINIFLTIRHLLRRGVLRSWSCRAIVSLGKSRFSSSISTLDEDRCKANVLYF